MTPSNFSCMTSQCRGEFPTIRSVNIKRAMAAILAVSFAAMNWRMSFHATQDSRFYDGVLEDAMEMSPPREPTPDHSHRWNTNITEFPSFMMDWPTDPFGPEGCSVFNTSLPHTFNVTRYPKSYSIEDIFIVIHGNLKRAWKHAGAANGSRTVRTVHAVHTNNTRRRRRKAPVTEVKTAACGFTRNWFLHHFPHQMQNIYPCWSFWRHFPDAEHVFVVGKLYYDWFTSGSAFTEGMVKVLNANNITIQRRTVKRFKYEFSARPGDLLYVYPNTTLIDGYRTVYEDDLDHLRRHALPVFGLERYLEPSCGVPPSPNTEHTNLLIPLIADANTTASGAAKVLNNQILRPPRIAISNRNTTRRMFGGRNISTLLQDELHLPYRPPVFFLEHMTFEQQIEAFNNVDILLTPHGAQLTLIPFMHRCSSVIEVFPRAYSEQVFFGRLAALSGVNHSYIYLGTDVVAETEPFNSFEGQKIPRAYNVCAPVHPMVEAVKVQIDRWHQCCGFT